MLLRRAAAGDRQALEQLVERLAPVVFRYGQVFCRNRSDAEDVMQDTLAALVRKLGSFRGDSALSTWTYVVARNACARMRRRRRFETGALEEGRPARGNAIELADPGPGPDEAFDRDALGAALGRAIRALPRELREAVLLRDIEGVSVAHAARALGIGEPAFKSRLHRARRALRDTLTNPTRLGSRPTSGDRCPDLAAALSRYLENDLDRTTCAEIEAHVSGCASCGEACDRLLASLALCRSAGSLRPPLRARRAVRQAIREALGLER